MDPNKMTLPARFFGQTERYATRPFLAFVGEKPLTYGEAGRQVRALMAFLLRNGISSGDRVALLGSNSPRWVLAYFAITGMGAVAVPLLPDFHAGEIARFVRHAGARMIFVDRAHLGKVQAPAGSGLLTVLLDDLSLQGEGVPYDAQLTDTAPAKVEEDDLAVIIYTSGTTGRSKGVMLTHRNLVFDALMSKKIHPIGEEDVFLSILPLSHTYENTIGMLIPMLSGSEIRYLRRPPTPAVLLPALREVRPTVMLTVPLIIEKIHKKQVMPVFTRNALIRGVYRFPPVRRLLHRMAGRRLMATFGGRLHFFGIGGAKLNETVERFLLEARFPYAVGYGLTETSPLVAGFGPDAQRLQSTGRPIEGIEVKIHNPDPENGEGEIWVRGPNVMKGYYKEPEMTREVLTADGWFRTGDLGTFDDDGYLYIKGRLKNVIIGPGGENIYPEDIESVINTLWYVDESLVVEEEGRLVALVRLNLEEIEKKFHSFKENATAFYEENVETFLKEVKEHVNRQVNRFSRIQEVKIQVEPFVKTATNKIKRFLYGEQGSKGKDPGQEGLKEQKV